MHGAAGMGRQRGDVGPVSRSGTQSALVHQQYGEEKRVVEVFKGRRGLEIVGYERIQDLECFLSCDLCLEAGGGCGALAFVACTESCCCYCYYCCCWYMHGRICCASFDLLISHVIVASHDRRFEGGRSHILEGVLSNFGLTL